VINIGRRLSRVLLAYADESGDSGPLTKSGASLTYTVGCLLIEADDWPAAFDAMLAYRRDLRTRHGVPMRAELKSTYLISGSGPLRPLKLTPSERQTIFREHLRLLGSAKMRAFGVVIDKRSANLPSAPDQLAWETIMERLERTTKAAKTPFALLHDNGNNLLVRKVARKARRRITAGSFYGNGQITLAAQRFVDDPVPRDSSESYAIQLADMVAYAAFRTVIAPGRSVRQVAPPDLWAELGAAVHSDVNKLRGGTPGVVVRKK
jgi:hypothetical protein